MPSPRRRYAPHPQQNPCHCEPVRTPVWQSAPPPRTAPSLHGGNGFPRRCAPRNDSFMKMRRPWTGGAEPPPDMHRTSNKILVIANRCAHRCGERIERCRWQKKRDERVAAVKILSGRRKAAPKFWVPQQGHPPPPAPHLHHTGKTDSHVAALLGMTFL